MVLGKTRYKKSHSGQLINRNFQMTIGRFLTSRFFSGYYYWENRIKAKIIFREFR